MSRFILQDLRVQHRGLLGPPLTVQGDGVLEFQIEFAIH
jgi:hypothetical protein